MQSLDRILSGPTANDEVAPLAEKHHDRSAADDFNRMMQAVLAPKSKESPHQIAARAERKHAAVHEAAEPAAKPVAAAVQNKTSSSEFATADGGSVKKAKSKNSAEQPAATVDNNFWPAQTESDPALPLTLPLPLTGGFISPQTATEFLAASVVKSSVTAAPMISEVGGVTSVTSSASAGTDAKAEPAATEKAKSLADELAKIKDGVKPDAGQPQTTSPDIAAGATVDAKKPAAEVAALAATAEAFQKTSTQAAAAVAAAETGGTGVAIDDLPMKKSANTIKVAGLDGKVLPSEATLTAAEKVLPTAAAARPVRVADPATPDVNLTLSMPSTFAAVDFTSTQSALILPSLTDARMRTLERAHDLVMLHAVRMVEAQTDAMHVVIKPDAGTELSLQLRQRDGFIEAEAILKNGDYQLMNQHWTELQERLEQRGIKLASLGGENQFSSDSGNFKQQQRDAARELEAQKASAFAEFAVANHAVGATARLAVGITGWESWA